MFLNSLDNSEKKAFLSLAHHVARSDKDFSDKQKEIILTYCFEMQIEDINYKEEEFDLTEVLNQFKNKKSQKIALLEIMALIYSDEFLHEEEQKIINEMLNIFKLDEKIYRIYLEWTKSILAISEQGKLLIEL